MARDFKSSKGLNIPRSLSEKNKLIISISSMDVHLQDR